jgi:hypothetical protein
MNLFELLFSVGFVLALLKIYAMSMRTSRQARPRRSAWGDLGPAVPGARASDSKEPDGERAEAIVVARRLAGLLAPEDYRRAMAELAARAATTRRAFTPHDHDA